QRGYWLYRGCAPALPHSDHQPQPTSYSERRPAAPPLPVPPAASRTIHSTTSGAMREKSEAARTLHSAQIHPGRCNLAQVRLHVADADVGDIVGRGVDGQREY